MQRGSKTVAAIIALIACFLLVVNMIPPEKNVENNPFLVEKGELPLIAAHRGGAGECPENTMMAFQNAIETVGVDILESDLHLTKDGFLVFNHNNYIDETCNVNGDLSLEEVKELCEDTSKRHYIHNMTLEELRQYNFGFYFEDEKGQRIYKDVEDPASVGLQITTLDQLFEKYYETHPDLLFILEIKGSQSRGINGCKALWEVLQQYPNYIDQIVVCTFHDEVETHLRDHYPQLLRGSSTETVVSFVATQLLWVNIFDQTDSACLQIPDDYGLGILSARHLVDRAHRRGIAVQYWTINSKMQMRRLIALGCDCIMTDYPALLKQVLEDYR